MLRFENLCAGYDGQERLHSLSASIAPGRLTVVIGPNGCGKSTLLKCAAGLLRTSSGRVLLDGCDLAALSGKARAQKIAYMPQSRLTPEISVRQLTAHGRYPHLKWGQNLTEADRRSIRRAMERAEILPHADRMVSRLSGGERQRAYLAMMLAQETPVMLLDEPTTYLDLSSQFALMELLRALCAEGRAALVALHDLALALEYADDVLLMRKGCLAAQGTPEEIYQTGGLQAVFGVEVARPDGRYVFSRRRQEEGR